jgi:hypothetical protein
MSTNNCGCKETYMCRPYIYTYYSLITDYIGLTHVRTFIENKNAQTES